MAPSRLRLRSLPSLDHGKTIYFIGITSNAYKAVLLFAQVPYGSASLASTFTWPWGVSESTQQKEKLFWDCFSFKGVCLFFHMELFVSLVLYPKSSLCSVLHL
jgi:hypothetical protein